ncbi:hypothetical protein ES319_A04G110800v1 [Gossypium barbadense]|uniref:Uncharacterized protein n=3 Tax=Gossypium TaxID=3633 RepID=A0A5J5W6X9_GOSBA|nr:hypothetical protein ES319_A04G110800v1 [Gossypium barbadense]KAB2087539.1 hypothetical protein ES319_A04G110800v1 [Gossypium barbadense]TYH22395.1 hypothetical protein ES288_A04G125000v1 [Gossypium darwinii]TYI33327.1 hypothetical protein ES332_A04G125400v1 [Gossypium tomentosum]
MSCRFLFSKTFSISFFIQAIHAAVSSLLRFPVVNLLWSILVSLLGDYCCALLCKIQYSVAPYSFYCSENPITYVVIIFSW